MSYCQQQGKDKIIFVTKEDHQEPSKIVLKEEEEEDDEPGLILPNGDINWNCPCLGGMATGPCGNQFREAFSCFHYSKEEPKGNDCFDKFKTMQECMHQYPNLYGSKSGAGDNDGDAKMAALETVVDKLAEEEDTTVEKKS